MTRPAAAAPAPPRLSPGFARLWAASVVSNLADGIGRIAVPLLAATLTRDPFAISALAALVYVPWLLFGAISGVLVDRVDRRRAMAAANAIRVLAAATLCVVIATGAVTIWLLYAVVLVWGLGETVFDTSVSAVVPALASREQLDAANSRMQASEILVQTFIAMPVGGVLFAVATVVPFVSTTAGFGLAALLVLTLPLAAARAGAAPGQPAVRTSVRGGMREAAHFVWRHEFLRAVSAQTILVGNALAFAQATQVLLFLERFGVREASFGVLAACVGAGALLGALSAGRLVTRFGRGRVLTAGILASGLGLVGAGLASHLAVLVACFAVSGAGVSVWNVPWGALRQQLVPGALLGRVTGAMRAISWGLFPVASLLGGWISRIDLQLPLLIGGVVVVAVTLLGARRLLTADEVARV